MSQHRTFVRAFTLIELLVVVAIIGLLVSILLPSLKLARDSAKGVVCGSNVRAQLQAGTQYADDNNDLMIAGLLTDWPANYLGPRNNGDTRSRNWGMGQQYLLPYLNYEIPLGRIPDAFANDPQEIERRQWQNLFGGPIKDGINANTSAYRGGAGGEWQRRMSDAFGSIGVYQCPGMPPITFVQSSDVTTCDLDYVMNAMPSPFQDINVHGGGGKRNLRPDKEAAPPQGVPVGSTHYWDKRSRSQIKYASEHMYIGEVDEGLVAYDLQSSGGQSNSFIFHNIFLATHLPQSRLSRIEDGFTLDGDNRKRHPGGANLGFFDGHVEMMGYSEVDPGFPTPVAIRIRKFADPSQLSAEWQ